MKKNLRVLLTTCMMLLILGTVFTGCEIQYEESASKACAHGNVRYEVILAATCTQDGTQQTVCVDCGEILNSGTIPKLGHDVDLTQAEVTNADCMNPKTYLGQCRREGCGQYVTSTEGEPLGHDCSETPIAATCTESAKIEYDCKRENCTYHYSEDVEGSEPLGHHYVDKEGTQHPADCTTTGSVTKICDREGCGDEYDDVIPALGHTSDGEKCEVTLPSCTEKGYTAYHCSVCEEDYKADYVQPNGHDLEDGDSVLATCSGNGYKTRACLTEDCGYTEKYDISPNLAHSFTDGKCTGCGKDVFEAFAIVCDSSAPFMIAQEGPRYLVYSESYTETTVTMPSNVVEELYKAGLYSFEIILGSATDKVTKSLSLKINGGDAKYVNVDVSEMKSMGIYTFADENGIFESAANGITFDVLYRAMEYTEAIDGADKVTAYAISFLFDRPFDIDNSNTYLLGAIPYTYNADAEQFTLMATYGEFSLHADWLKYYYDLGYTNVVLEFDSGNGQMLSFNVYAISNDQEKGHNMANVSARLSLALTEELASSNLLLKVYSADLFGTAWDPANPADKMLLKVKFTKPMGLDTFLSVAGEKTSVSYDKQQSTWTLNNENKVDAVVTFGAEYLIAQKNLGKLIMRVTFDKTYAVTNHPASFYIRVVKNGGWVNLYGWQGINEWFLTDAEGNTCFEIDLSENYDFAHAAGSLEMMFRDEKVVINKIEFLDLSSKNDYFTPRGTGTSTVSYDDTNDYWVVTQGDDAHVGLSSWVINKHIKDGEKKLRITFTGTPVSTSWLAVYATKGGVQQQLYYTWDPSKDAEGNEYVEISLDEWDFSIGLGLYLELVFSQATTNVSLDFMSAGA